MIIFALTILPYFSLLTTSCRASELQKGRRVLISIVVGDGMQVQQKNHVPCWIIIVTSMWHDVNSLIQKEDKVSVNLVVEHFNYSLRK